MPYLITAATDFELQAFMDAGGDSQGTLQLVTGIGPLETAVSLCAMLQEHTGRIDGVLNFGVAGGYPDNGSDTIAGLLDICLATREVLGDLGICLEDGFERLTAPQLRVKNSFIMDPALLGRAGDGLDGAGISWKTGTFITVNCASGTLKRGRLLAREFGGLCENMEGAAVARTCAQFALPCVEVRCISNMVVDRNPDDWKLQQACSLAGRAAAAIIAALQQE